MTDDVKDVVTDPRPSLWQQLSQGAQDLLNQGGKRQLELRKPDGGSVFQLSLIWATTLLFAAFIFGVLPLVAIATVLLLVFKYQFVLLKQE